LIKTKNKPKLKNAGHKATNGIVEAKVEREGIRCSRDD